MNSVIAAIGFGPFDTDWLAAAIILTAPLLLAAMGELVSERAGVLNVGLEGMMLAGAFFSYLVAWKANSLVVGAFAGIGAGLLFAVVMGLLSIVAKADQIVSGVGVNLAATGLTSFLFDQIFGNRAQVVVPTMGNIKIPLLEKIPDFGPALFDHDILTYIAFLLVPAIWFLLYRTRWGLAIRAAGEMPAAVDTAGINVQRVRWAGVLTAGGLSGLAGANLAIVQVGIFHQEMSAGRGFLALVAVIFGRWTPLGVLGACLVLGGADALQLRLADQSAVPHQLWVVLTGIAVVLALYMVLAKRGRQRQPVALSLVALVAAGAVVLAIATPHVSLPDQLWRSLPYLLALAVLAGALSRSRMPSKLTIPYSRGEG
ncbi:MAG TPA: ABC transporter permease [Conexibacter sp.]|jgi:simple sugar transport system permease protein